MRAVPIGFVDREFIACMAVIRDAMIFLHVGKSHNVCDAIWVEAYRAVPREVTDKVRCRAASETNSTCKLTVLRVEPHVISAHKRMRIIPCYFFTKLHDVRFILL
jgi:hypothetical protein